MKQKRVALGAAAVAAALWLGLFISNHAVLVWSDTEEEGPGQRLVCRYFTGAGIVTRQHLRLGDLGREACPRWISLAGR